MIAGDPGTAARKGGQIGSRAEGALRAAPDTCYRGSLDKPPLSRMTDSKETSIISAGSNDNGVVRVTTADARARDDLRVESTAPNTRRAYRADWERFHAWCAARGGDPTLATPEVVAVHLATLRGEGLLYVSIARAAAGICCELAKYDRGTWLSRPWQVKAVLKDLARAMGRAPRYDKKPLTLDLLEPGVAAAYPGWTLREARNRALVVFGYYLATRRTEVVGLRFRDLDTSQLERRGVGIVIRRSKTDQEGVGISKWVVRQPAARFCPVQCLTDWVATADLAPRGMAPADAYVFPELSSHGTLLDGGADPTVVSVAVKEVVAAIQLDPADYGAHSLRSGFVTDASAMGVPLEEIANQTGHRSLEQLRKYIKRLHPWQSNATERFAKRTMETPPR